MKKLPRLCIYIFPYENHRIWTLLAVPSRGICSTVYPFPSCWVVGPGEPFLTGEDAQKTRTEGGWDGVTRPLVCRGPGFGLPRARAPWAGDHVPGQHGHLGRTWLGLHGPSARQRERLLGQGLTRWPSSVRRWLPELRRSGRPSASAPR